MAESRKFLLDGETEFHSLVEPHLNKPGQESACLLADILIPFESGATLIDYKFLVFSCEGIFVLDSYFSPAVGEDNSSVHLDVLLNSVKQKTKSLESWGRKQLGDFSMPVTPGLILLGHSNLSAVLSERALSAGVKILSSAQWLKVFHSSRSGIGPQTVRSWFEAVSEIARSGGGGHLSIRDYSELEIAKSEFVEEQSFRKVFKAKHGRGKTKALVYVYDLTGGESEAISRLAEREYNALFKLGKSQYAPQVIESIRELSSLGGAVKYFSLVDSDAPSIAERAEDAAWSIPERVSFACRALEALGQIHSGEASVDDVPVIHRNIHPSSLRIRSNGEPLFTSFYCSKISANTTCHSSALVGQFGDNEWQAPEVREIGLAGASCASDIFSLCRTLSILFNSPNDATCAQVQRVLNLGTTSDAKSRLSIRQLVAGLAPFGDERSDKKQMSQLEVRFWDEGTRATLNNKCYQIARRLGSGGMGSAFLMYQVRTTLEGEEELAIEPVVGKVFTNEKLGSESLWAHTLIHPVSGGEHLATIFDTVSVWRPNHLSAVLKWIEGDVLWDKIGQIERYFSDQRVADVELQILDWIKQVCLGLSHLHRRKLVHGDVTPKNIILDGQFLTLTDFDLSGQEGRPCSEARTPSYSAPEVDRKKELHCSQDVYSLAASIFHVFTGHGPFDHPTGFDKQRGCNWSVFDRARYPKLFEFIQRATDPRPERRFANALEAVAFVNELMSDDGSALTVFGPSVEDAVSLTEQKVPWLTELLSTYQGSLVGNEETRGLDSHFAKQTYVETELDLSMSRDIQEGKVSLVILCGNAGDGKTAFIQNLAKRLGYESGVSSVRVWEHHLEGGRTLRANLDGSAAFEGKSANEMLTDFLSPFFESPFPEHLVHILAINNGKLLEWLDERSDSCYLTDQLEMALSDDVVGANLDPRIKFIDLNERSLVGSVSRHRDTIQADFFDELVSRMLGHEEDVWAPCARCTAQTRCTAWRSVQTLRDPELGTRILKHLLKAFRMVHQKGDVHITARNLRGALTYIFFGIHSCRQLHDDPSLHPSSYFERAFNVFTENRQGELLAELAKLDPAIDSGPRQDKLLLSLEDSNDLPLSALRRRAYFEGIPGGTGDESIGLLGGAEFELFEKLVTQDPIVLSDLCHRLCDGLARLEDLPEVAFADGNVVALRVMPNTPTETIFWTAREHSRFSLVIPPIRNQKLEWLPFQVILRFQYRDGRFEDLYMGYGLFHRLLRAREGEQLSDASTDDIYASLSVFKQRVISEESRTLMAWNPTDEIVRRISVRSENSRQVIHMEPVT